MKLWDKFVEATTRHFHFLETDFGFVHKQTRPPFIIFESDKLQVLVYFDDDNRGELDLSIRRLGDDPRKTPSIGPTAMMLLMDRQAAESYQSPFLSTEEHVETQVQRLAELLQKYGANILKSDEREFERIERLRQEKAKELATQRHPNSPRS